MHRTILNLGRKDLLAAHLDFAKLTRLLHGEAAPERAVRREDVHAMAAWDWGAMLVARHLWCELGLEAVLDRLAGGGPHKWGGDAIIVQPAYESRSFPVAVWHLINEPFALRSPAIEAGHFGGGGGLIDEDKLLRIKD